jgi:allophanate hydrolase
LNAFSTHASPTAAVEDAYARIDALDDNPVFIHVVPRPAAMARARELEASSKDLPLKGVTFAVKDNIDVAGIPTTAACPAFSYSPQRSAFVVQKLLDAGAILVGKTNLDQFATGLAGTRSPYGACRNAFDPRYISGGSSSGSAVAVAKGIASFSLGTDTAGSGRVPAAFNALVGLKPTRGRLSTAGVVPACRSLDCVSIFSSTVAQALEVLAVVEGFDPTDGFSRPVKEISPKDRTIAVPRKLEFFGDCSYAKLFHAAVGRMEKLGALIAEIDSAPFLEVQALLYDGPWLAERAAALEDFVAKRSHELHPVTRKVIQGGARYSAVDAFRGQYKLAALRRSCEAAMNGAQILMVPGTPTIYTVAQLEADPIELNSRLGLYTNFANLLDMAAITVPAGARPDGIPFGVTLLGPAFTDRALAALAARFSGEEITPEKTNAIRVAVVGAHLAGMPLNHQLTSRGARLVRAARTAPAYRLYALSDQKPVKPGLVRVGNGDGSRVDVEVWELDAAGFGAFVAEIPPPLGIGTLQLEDGEQVKGFVCEGYAVAGREDISRFGGWRKYLQEIQ